MWSGTGNCVKGDRTLLWYEKVKHIFRTGAGAAFTAATGPGRCLEAEVTNALCTLLGIMLHGVAMYLIDVGHWDFLCVWY